MTQPQSHKRPSVGLVSLGCPKALVDSEDIVSRLKSEGYDIAPSHEDADLVVVNTCGFIDSAKAESLESIGEALNANGKVLVTGCMGAKPEDITRIHPKVLGITGPHQAEAVVRSVNQNLPRPHDPRFDLVPPGGLKLTPQHYAYLKISEGCNHKCRFCIIPSMRGRLVSRPLGMVMREAEQLAERGVQELLVISQDTSAYGVDLKYQTDYWRDREYQTRLYDLCDALGELGIWVRLHYVYPYPHVDNIIELMNAGRILPYLDIPFQHASRSVLKAMRRPAAAENTLERIHKWRKQCPELVIRSTFIVGFPGETEDDFRQLLDWLDEAQLDRVGCFKYSPVEGAAANELPDPVPDEVAEERWHRFMQHQSAISARRLQRRVGGIEPVLVDSIEGDIAIARSYGDAPEIDGQVVVSGAIDPQPGDALMVRITRADEYDLQAEAVDESELQRSKAI
ncbi:MULTISPECIES: 30S ribosomal protein S12 methylthiotransferase RimO [unclassified Wenzhouxiangella]|uniref:30S ribosomal protein S12 methylthiotransferase RimO n=1 Tax=unclassified Wenzhouxiangella TaxID=2613841 RepID=UPI000E32A614|nr:MULTISPECIES: 30S ribosomal protein S12 methylthiotransferase RimO [unclassified Wenzhouxiangella]RFF28323.1 30S ribosomal protein S12 methylthiotransferase RimO [Wenzhouxiangella sp. 15181]RFP67752.1 30S ribosomal protein S12 methylthiotransferase RimO [Wenzhouxiangella sp. 15190]